jgi:hypothetical protein
VKSKLVGDALNALASLASQIVSGAAHSAATSLEAGAKPSPADIGKQALATLQAVGSQAVGTLVTHGGMSQTAVDATLQALVASAAAALQSDAGTPVVVPPVPGVSGK